MLKFSSILLIASICVFASLCVSAKSGTPLKLEAVAEKDYFGGNLKTFFDAFSDISGSSNEFVKFLREQIKEAFEMFEKHKKEIQDSVTEGTEMEKKIQDILTTLKNFTIPLPQELQTELETIEKTAADELTKLKGMNKVDDIEAMKTKYNTHYEAIKTKMELLSKMAATSPPVSTPAQGSSQVQITPEKVTEMETKLFEFIKTILPALRTADTDEETVSGKLRNVHTSLSKIRHELIKVERIQFHLLRSQNQFKTDAAPSVRSPMVQFAIAIMLGMLF